MSYNGLQLFQLPREQLGVNEMWISGMKSFDTISWIDWLKKNLLSLSPSSTNVTICPSRSHFQGMPFPIALYLCFSISMSGFQMEDWLDGLLLLKEGGKI